MGVLVNDWNLDITHLVATRLRCTLKLMCAICRGIPVVRPVLFDSCSKLQVALGLAVPEMCLLEDREGETECARRFSLPGYSLAAALQRARTNGPVLRGSAVCMLDGAGARAATRLPPESARLLVEAAGGTWLENGSTSVAEASAGQVAVPIVSGPDSDAPLVEQPVAPPSEKPTIFLAKAGADIPPLPTGLAVYDVEALLAAACTQYLDLERYRLSCIPGLTRRVSRVWRSGVLRCAEGL